MEKIREWEYKKYIKPHVSYEKYLPSYYAKHKGSLSVETILRDIQQGDLYGIVEVDIEVPSHSPFQ